MSYTSLKYVIINVRSMISESKSIMGEALKALRMNKIETAEALASKALKRLERASQVLSDIEARLIIGGGGSQ